MLELSSASSAAVAVLCSSPAMTRMMGPDAAALSQIRLAAAKARGVKLGGDRGYRPVAAPDGRLGGEAVRQAADHAAHRAMVAIEAVRADHGSDVSLHAVARRLTERQIATPRGGIWTATAVRRVLAKAAG